MRHRECEGAGLSPPSGAAITDVGRGFSLPPGSGQGSAFAMGSKGLAGHGLLSLGSPVEMVKWQILDKGEGVRWSGDGSCNRSFGKSNVFLHVCRQNLGVLALGDLA